MVSGVLEAQPLAQEPHLFLRIEEFFSLLLYQHLSENAPQQVDETM